MKTSNTFLKPATIELEIYSECKYIASEEAFENAKRIRYERVESFDIVSGFEALDEIERYTDGSCIDDFHEYLVLHFEYGDTSTFRNSYVDMFRVR